MGKGETRFRNPQTGELLIHKERRGRRELLYGIQGSEGGRHGHAVWDGNALEYHRDENGSVVADAAIDRREAMAGKETSRGGIEQGKKQIDQKYEEADQEFRKDVRTKKAIAVAAAEAHVSGTDEGMRDVKQRVDRAGEEADKKFESDEKGQAQVIESGAKPREQHLQEMTEHTKADVRALEKAIAEAEVDGSKNALNEGRAKASEDADYTEKQRQALKESREKAEKNAQEKGQEMRNARTQFRR